MCPQNQRIQPDIWEFKNHLLIESIEVLKVPGPLVSCSEGVATGHGATLSYTAITSTLHITLYITFAWCTSEPLLGGGVICNVCSSQRKPRQNHFKTPMFGIVLA